MQEYYRRLRAPAAAQAGGEVCGVSNPGAIVAAIAPIALDPSTAPIPSISAYIGQIGTRLASSLELRPADVRADRPMIGLARRVAAAVLVSAVVGCRPAAPEPRSLRPRFSTSTATAPPPRSRTGARPALLLRLQRRRADERRRRPGLHTLHRHRIQSYLTSLGSTLDVDGIGGAPAALTDGQLILRFLFGFSGNTLVSGAVGVGAADVSPAT